MNTGSDPVPAPEQDARSQRYHDQILRRRRRWNIIMFFVTLVCAVAYIAWAVLHLNTDYWYVGVPYLLAELLCFGSLLIWSGMMIHRRDHPPRGMPIQDPPPAVDVIITCCGEPFRVVEKTLRATAAIDYPNFKVTVADDRQDPEVGILCDELGFTHLCRTNHEHRKAGNLNYAYARTSAPFLLVLDSDQIPHHSILKVMMGYFALPHIGFVTAYQGFDVPKGDPWANRDRVFYGAMQPAKNDANSAISCGSGVVYRRTALNQIGGFSTWNLVEDLYTSLLLHNAGWKSIYHPFPVTHGTAPMEISSHVRQRWQWAVDSLRLLFWRNPAFTRGLTWRQRMNYVSFGYNYLVFGLAYPVFYLLPIWGLFSGKFFLDTSATEFLIWRLPYAAAYFIFNRLLTDHRHTAKTFRAQTGLFEVFFSAILTALFSRKRVPEYSVSKKTVERPALIERIHHVLPHLCLIVFCLGGIAYGFIKGNASPAFYYVNAAWALWVIWLIFPFTKIALKNPPDVEFR